MQELFKGKRVLVTGAAGTVGKELVRQVLQLGVQEVRALDNNESELFYLNERYAKEPRLNCFFGDIRNLESLTYVCRNADIVLHLAALKHVIISEQSPLNAIKTNVEGTANVIQAALASESVSLVLYTSSDKAVNPTNVMGTTKLLGERLMSSGMNLKGDRRILFSTTRFGNVIGSKGSVVPIFFKQIRDGDHLTITDPGMTRFIMTIPDAARLVLDAAVMARGGEVFVTKMPVIRIPDLAQAMIDLVAPMVGKDPAGIGLKVIGAKPGEKLYEELMTAEEVARAKDIGPMFLIRPAFPPLYDDIRYVESPPGANEITSPYVSAHEPCLSVDEIKDYLTQHRVLENLEH